MLLRDILADPAAKSRFIAGGVALIESEVSSKSGLQGMALKAGFKTLKKVRPGILRSALEMLLPHFAPVVEPHFSRGQSDGDVAGYFARHASGVAEAMLQVTDARAAQASNRLLKRTYRSLRGQALTHTTQAMPGVGRLLASFV
jgi:hypothetical protein